jgi:hypothetical protein
MTITELTQTTSTLNNSDVQNQNVRPDEAKHIYCAEKRAPACDVDTLAVRCQMFSQ